MVLKKHYSKDFEKLFTGRLIIDPDIKAKLKEKHSVLKADLEDGLGDPYLIVLKGKQKDKIPSDRLTSRGQKYEILCETTASRVLYIVCRLFEDGNLLIITARFLNQEKPKDLNAINFYYTESEVLMNEDENS